MTKKRMKVLFVSSWYSSRVNETLGNFVQKHAEAVSRYADVSVLYVCFDGALTKKKSEIVINETDKVKTLHIYCKKSSNPLIRFNRYLKAYKKGLKLFIEKFSEPDLIHVNVVFPVGLLFYFLKSFKKYPFVITEHWAGYLQEYPTKPGFLKKYLIRKICKCSSAILPVTRDLSEAMQNLGFTGNYKVVPNVVETTVFTLSPKVKSEVVNILHVSSLDDDQKNMTGILNVMNKLSRIRKDFSLHIISDGNQQPFIEKAMQLSLNDKFVFFHGAKKTMEVAEMMKRSDFLLLFSNYENLPCVIVEAYSCGLPVVSTDVGGISEHLTEKHGLLIKPGDEEALLHTLENMLDHVHEYDREFLHEYAEKNFSYENVGKKYFDVYSEIINK